MRANRLTLGVHAIVFLAAQAVLAADEKADMPFNGKNLDGWKLKGSKEKSNWTVGVAKLNEQSPNQLTVADAADGKAELVNSKNGGVDI
jgi:hypothetical protein